MELSENTVILGKYRLSRMIGRGGMGSVWHATQLDLDRPCAIKFIEGEYASLPEAQERFKREAVAASKINSPYIVQVYEHGIWDGTPFIAMEYLEGEDLGKRIQKLGRVSPGETHTVLQQVCRALGKAHQAGIVHRDMKPDNIFLVRDDEREVAKVVDFGIAKLGANPLEGSKTRTGAMLGTPYYMSPEQAQGTKAIDPRSDLWSLAIITFQCITGVLPFESEALGDLLVKIIVSPIPVPSATAAGVPPGFDQWFAKAASRDPRERFQTAREFSEALGLALGTSGVGDATTTGMQQTPGYGTPAVGNPQFAQSGMGPSHLSQSSSGSTVAMGSRPGFQTPLPMNQSAGGLSAHTNSGVTSVEDIGRPPVKKAPIGLIIGGAVVGLALLVGGIVAMSGGKKDKVGAEGVPTATAEVKTTEAKATEVKPDEVKPVEAKVETKPVETKPDVKPAETKPEATVAAGGEKPKDPKAGTKTGTKHGKGGVAGKVDNLGF